MMGTDNGLSRIPVDATHGCTYGVLRPCCYESLRRKERARIGTRSANFSLPKSNDRGVSHRIYRYAGSTS